MAFFTFTQNNSGENFDVDEKAGIAEYVIIEADTYDDANDRAMQLGMYFNGVGEGFDCPCCGDRWSPVWQNDGTEKPIVYGKHPAEHKSLFGEKGKTTCVHYENGLKEWF